MRGGAAGIHTTVAAAAAVGDSLTGLSSSPPLVVHARLVSFSFYINSSSLYHRCASVSGRVLSSQRSFLRTPVARYGLSNVEDLLSSGGIRFSWPMLDVGGSLGFVRKTVFVVRGQSSRFFKKHRKSSQETIESFVRNLCRARGGTVMETLNGSGRWMSPVDWFDVLAGIGRNGQWLLALEVFRWIQMQEWYKPAAGYYAKLITIMGKQQQYRLAMTMFKEMRKSGCRPSTSLYNSVMILHLRGKDREEGFAAALHLFEEMKMIRPCVPNVVTYNILTRVAAQLGRQDVLDGLFKDMGARDVRPDHYTFNGILDAYGKAGEICKAEDLLSRMRMINKLKPDEVTFNVLIDAYGKAKEFDKMEFVLSSMTRNRKTPRKPSVRTYNSLITHYGSAGLVNKLEWVLKDMQKRGVLPTFLTYETLINAFGKCGDFEKMEVCLRTMRAVGFVPQSSSLNKMLESYCRYGMIAEAEALLTNSSWKCGVAATSLSYAIVIREHRKAGRRNEMQALLERMKRMGLKPTKQTYLDFLEHIGLAQDNQKRQDSGTDGIINGLDDVSTIASATNSDKEF